MKNKGFDASKLNIIDPTKPKSIWDPNSEFMKELEITKLRLETRPRKVNMMQSQIGMIKDMCADPSKPKIFIPGRGGNV